MSMTRYSPWLVQSGLQDELKQVFDKFFGEAEGDQSNVVTSQWAPRVDIREDADRFVILADIPGVDPKDIEVHMDKGILSIKGAHGVLEISIPKRPESTPRRIEVSRGDG